MATGADDIVTGTNEAIISGQLVSEIERRVLPSGSVAASFSLTVRRPGEKTTSVPLCWFDPPTRIDNWTIGEMVVARGQVVRRFYRGGQGLVSATEVVVVEAHPARHRSRASKVVLGSSARLDELHASLDGSV